MKDRNGIELREGDVCVCHPLENEPEDSWITYSIVEVVDADHENLVEVMYDIWDADQFGHGSATTVFYANRLEKIGEL
jgi:hypothetical protein